MISVVIPTLPERREYLERALDSLQSYTEREYQVIAVTDGDSWGTACAIGAEQATGDYLLFFSDDMEVLPDWENALRVCDEGNLPAPLMYYMDGRLQSGGSWEKLLPDGVFVNYTVLPLLSRAQYEDIGPMPAIHFADAALSELARAKGYKIRLCWDYRILHRNAPEGRRTRREANNELDEWRSANR